MFPEKYIYNVGITMIRIDMREGHLVILNITRQQS